MDAIGFQTWLSDFNRKFPAVREWLRTLGDGDQDALLDGWERAFSKLDLQDCLQATQRLLEGEQPIIGEWPTQWQGIPAKVRSHVAALDAERRDSSPRDYLDEREHIRTLIARDRLKTGVSREEISRELVAAGFEGLAVK